MVEQPEEEEEHPVCNGFAAEFEENDFFHSHTVMAPGMILKTLISLHKFASNMCGGCGSMECQDCKWGGQMVSFWKHQWDLLDVPIEMVAKRCETEIPVALAPHFHSDHGSTRHGRPSSAWNGGSFKWTTKETFEKGINHLRTIVSFVFLNPQSRYVNWEVSTWSPNVSLSLIERQRAPQRTLQTFHPKHHTTTQENNQQNAICHSKTMIARFADTQQSKQLRSKKRNQMRKLKAMKKLETAVKI